MRQKKILHILDSDKFSLPFARLVNKEFNPDDHLFLFTSRPDNDLASSNSNIYYFVNPYRKNLIKNTFLFFNCVNKASKIILHGIPLLFYLFIYPWKLGKTYWIIQGYEISSEISGNTRSGSLSFQNFLKRFVLRRVYGHITHISGDSEFANTYFNSSAKFFYSPIYPSNVVSHPVSDPKKPGAEDGITKILVGNSTSPTNSHDSIFEMLSAYKNDNIIIYCPLSYGNFPDYRNSVIRRGSELFNDKFVPLTEFMKLDEYMSLLGSVDIAIFNHRRQEAMGVTLQLLNFGKTVYMNSTTTSFKSFIERGFSVFDNDLIEKEGLYVKRDVLKNPELVSIYYNYETLLKSLSEIFND